MPRHEINTQSIGQRLREKTKPRHEVNTQSIGQRHDWVSGLGLHCAGLRLSQPKLWPLSGQAIRASGEHLHGVQDVNMTARRCWRRTNVRCCHRTCKGKLHALRHCFGVVDWRRSRELHAMALLLCTQAECNSHGRALVSLGRGRRFSVF